MESTLRDMNYCLCYYEFSCINTSSVINCINLDVPSRQSQIV